MSLTLAESQAVREMAGLLYDFLPGKPHPYADQRVSFLAAAAESGVADFWSGASKLPAVTLLLQSTLEERRDRFCDLLKKIVERALVYKRSRLPGRTSTG